MLLVRRYPVGIDTRLTCTVSSHILLILRVVALRLKQQKPVCCTTRSASVKRRQSCSHMEQSFRNFTSKFHWHCTLTQSIWMTKIKAIQRCNTTMANGVGSFDSHGHLCQWNSCRRKHFVIFNATEFEMWYSINIGYHMSNFMPSTSLWKPYACRIA